LKVAEFHIPHGHFAPLLGVTPFEFHQDSLGYRVWCGVVSIILGLAVLVAFGVRTCDRQTDRQTRNSADDHVTSLFTHDHLMLVRKFVKTVCAEYYISFSLLKHVDIDIRYCDRLLLKLIIGLVDHIKKLL